MAEMTWRILAALWLWSLRARKRTRRWLLRNGDDLHRFLLSSVAVVFGMAVLAAPQSVSPQDLDRLRQEFIDEQRRQNLLGLAETVAWIAGVLGSLYLIKQRGVDFIKAVLAFVRLVATGPLLLREVIESQKLIHADITMLAARLRILEDNSKVACFVTDEEGRWVGVSERLCELIGAWPPKIHNHGWKVHIKSLDRERIFGDWSKAVSSGEPFAADFYCVHDDGTQQKVSLNAAAQLNPHGKVIGYVGTVRPLRGSGEVPIINGG